MQTHSLKPQTKSERLEYVNQCAIDQGNEKNMEVDKSGHSVVLKSGLQCACVMYVCVFYAY